MRHNVTSLPDPVRRALRIATTEVSVTGLKVEADIGVFADEMIRRQQLIIDTTLRVREVPDDDLQLTFDYIRLQDIALDLGAQRTALIETFARRFAQRCLECNAVDAADITVWKPMALTNGTACCRIVVER